jgi:aspartate racemase
VHWFTTTFSITANDRVLLVSSPSFDLTQKNIFSTLMSGGELHLLAGREHDPDKIARRISEQSITLVNCTPSAFYPVVERDEIVRSGMLSSLRVLFLGGESISIQRLRPWLENDACDCEIVNTYGPTECTDISASYRMNRQNLNAYSFVPIGRPIFNVQLVVVDDKSCVCPPGVAGELCVAGVGVGAGYINDHELTATKFLSNPFPELVGDRIYRTGDRVRILSDGNIEYLERMDHQVKLRGFRIELGEIEAALVQHPTVREAVVVADEDPSGDKRLVAYFVSSLEPVPTASEIRGFLQQKLPDFMIPSTFIPVASIPLTPSGKVNRRALPAPDHARPEWEKSFVAPRDSLELQLTKVWEKVLEAKPIGVRDNFFSIGGHSLLAIRLIAQIKKKVGKDLPLSALFQAPTVEELANLLRQKRDSECWSSLLALQPNGSKLPFFCVQGTADLARHMGPDQPVYALQPPALDGRESSCKVEELAIDFIKEIRALQPHGPYFLGGFSFGGKVAFEMAHQLRNQGQDVRLLALLDPGVTGNGRMSSPISSILRSSFRTITRFCAGFHRHLHRLALLRPRQKLTYLWRGVRWRVEAKIQKIETAIKKIVCSFYLAIGRRLPPGLRVFYFVQVSRRALQEYVPQVYPGRVIVFPTEEMTKDARSQWERLAGGGVEFHVVPGSHSNVLTETNVRLWAKKLRTCLDAAQAGE